MPTVFALGTYSRNLGVYLDPLNLLCLHEAQQKGGITHVQFTPDGSKLLAGGRKDKEILVWDLRNPGEFDYFILFLQFSLVQKQVFKILSQNTC
jgi:WD40 repeat protein